MRKRAITTEKAPKAIGPYSQAIAAGDLIFTAGQIPLDPASGQLVTGSFAAQAHRVLDNVKAVLEAAGSDMDHVVKVTCYLTDLTDFAELNGIYGTFFGEPHPARSAVQVAALPRGAKLEIETIAVRS